MLRFHLLFVFIVGGYIITDAQGIYEGIVGCYSFSGNALDNSGGGNHGNVHGAQFVADRYGVNGSALQFNGSSDYVSLPASSFTNDAFTYSAWFKIENYPLEGESYQIFFAGSLSGAVGQGLKIYTDGGWIQAILESSGATPSDSCFFGINLALLAAPNNWNHIAAAYDDCGIVIYVNGKSLAYTVAEKVTNPAYGSSPLAFIGKKTDNNQYFKGMLDDVIIYNRALSHDELKQLFIDNIGCNLPPLAPQIISDTVTICGSGKATFYADGGEAFRWYEDQAGGSVIYEGNNFTTPELLYTTDYFVSNVMGAEESQRVRVVAYVAPLPDLVCQDVKSYVHQQVLFKPSVTSGTPPYTYTLDAGDGSGATVSDLQWSHIYSTAGSYELIISVSDVNHCNASCSQLIQVDDIFIPNVITANEDTFNNQLTVYERRDDEFTYFAGEESFEMSVVNRWGVEIFSSTDIRNGWQGENADAGVYFYTITLGREIYKGSVSLFK